MKLKNDLIDLSVSPNGEISSIKYKNQEILHDGKEYWNKIYPMVWPNTSISTAFEVDGKNYKLPKHGFWKELMWDGVYEGSSITMMATHFSNDIYPFSIDIQNNIEISNNEIIISTTFSNLGKDTAYFGFGHHPAFKIDDQSIFKVENKEKPQMINSEGKLLKDKIAIENVKDIPFGNNFDTLVWKDITFDKATLTSNNLIIEFNVFDFESLQLWKPEGANFVCVEPWQGWNDLEYTSPSKVSEKIGLIKLTSGDVVTKKFVIKINEENKKH